MIKCYWCDRKAVMKDYREMDGIVHKLPSCQECFGLDTSYLRKKYRNKSTEKRNQNDT